MQNEVRVTFSNFIFCSIVAKFILMNMHVCVSAHKGNIVIYQMQSTGRDFVGEFLLAKFLSKYVVWVCGEVCGEELAKCLLLFSSLRKPAEISQQTSPRTKAPNPKESTRWQDFLHQIYSLKSFSHNLDYQFVGPKF